MRYAILSDIHANLEAFQAVLNDIEQRGGFDRLWHLGDVVGYGPDPAECIAMLSRYDAVCVAGNHDWAACGRMNTQEFNHEAASAAKWTAERLGPSEKDYLSNLPERVEEDGFTLVHGSPREPIWEYVVTASIAGANFAHFTTPVCLVGHSHMPLVYVREDDGECAGRKLRAELELDDGKKMIVNPGAVGQPRDGNPAAAYALFDTETGLLTPYRVTYAIEKTQQKMKDRGLPTGLWARLKAGV